MSQIMPPPIFQKPPSWDDCRCAKAQDRFYEEHGLAFGTGFAEAMDEASRIAARLRGLAGRLATPRRRRLTKPSQRPSC
ncbi:MULTISPECIES: hypothetical protein [unclassified Roseitalea]|uniref:hypothetical protein n=1 Tax=unclassified Roseitalea TaxID=2639107 RepID=UPI00273DE894|nr:MULTISPECIES: hypothetical protein [unclassified Roseitalea]